MSTITPDQARALLKGGRFVNVLRHGSMELEIYAPQGQDNQQPHTRDELYVVISGTGHFDNNGSVTPFAPGDVLIVRAGAPHRFTDFTDDFATWVLFSGPDGGEVP